ncbi:MAG: hypothetical protein K9K76_04705, partial [Halanaerobiales bacterium]|nr:hypothetical protein [Halanaerobiales bacterium]
FLRDVLNISLSLIGIIDYGYVSVYKDNNWQTISKRGYRNNTIELLNRKKDLIIEEQENIFKSDLMIINNKNIHKYIEIDEISEELKEYLNKAKKINSESAFFDLTVDDKKVRVSLDISTESKETFDKNDLKIIKAFRNLINVFLKNNSSLQSDEIDIFED